jgi:hypothetical protein
MADSETFAALARQLDDLRGTVARLHMTVTQWDARLELEGIGATLVLRAEVQRLSRTLTEALAKHRLEPPVAPYWLHLDPAELGQRLAELRSWVEDFLRVQYPGYAPGLRACWMNHPEAVWELSTLMTEWLRVYGDADNRDLAAALWWHERWLPGVLARLGKAIPCDETGCRLPQRQALGL